jgi:hypothetical protein
MNGNKLLLFTIAITGIVLWNMPSTFSAFAGDHAFYIGSSPCIKCHGDANITTMTNTSAHDDFSCNVCHRAEPNITYETNQTTGQQAHSASMGTSACLNCHISNVTNTTSPTSTPSPTPTPGAPIISSWGNNKTNDQNLALTTNTTEAVSFNVTANQMVNVTWLINGTKVFNQTDVTNSTYINSNASEGIWNITAIVNNTNGTDSKTWNWNVTVAPAPTTTPTPTSTLPGGI